ncbi:MAG: hypothetical protein A2171_03020 [Candidatus Levybacteria bacterium RBG_13_35_9]|nr:MAG: hypothetical protein A2171_03020 [Candidatus Levybacteria bacterium RBG_13_35_9]
MPNNFLFLGFAIFLVWLVTLTFFFWRILSHYNRITKGVSQKSLRTVLEELLNDSELNKKDIQHLKEYSARIERQGFFHIQKVGLLRFNPFKDTGGDQSFILSLVNGEDTGVIISALYSRSGTRWYVKKVIKGKGVEYELSEEEKKALKESTVSK